MAPDTAAALAARLADPGPKGAEPPDPTRILFDTVEPPPFPANNIFPLEWEVETPKLQTLYDVARDPGWRPDKLAWETLRPEDFTAEEREAIAYWYGILAVFDSSGPAVFARAMIHTFETHEEDPIRKCFFAVTRDEVNHDEICQRVIGRLTPGGPLRYTPQSDLGRLAQNNVKWYYHNGARYWEGYKNAVHKYPLASLFTSFLMGEVASATLFRSMYEKTTIPVLKEAMRCVGQDEARHMGICLTVLKKLLPRITDAERATITKQLRAGYVFLSGILYIPPEHFWELPDTWRPAHLLLEEKARAAGLGILTVDERLENWRTAVLKLKGVVEPHGIKFPAIPEIGIDGETVAFDPNDIIPVF